MKTTTQPKALVIDDDPAVLRFLHHLFEKRGFLVAAFEKPNDSSFLTRDSSACLPNDNCPDVIIADHILPDTSGADVLVSAMENTGTFPHTALMSGMDIPEDELIRLAKYGTRFFTKPLDFNDFNDWLNRVERDLANKPFHQEPR